jgi:hypothetical protein
VAWASSQGCVEEGEMSRKDPFDTIWEIICVCYFLVSYPVNYFLIAYRVGLYSPYHGGISSPLADGFALVFSPVMLVLNIVMGLFYLLELFGYYVFGYYQI